jgi:hypothetical protein
LQEILGICTLFGLERIADCRFIAFVVQSRADEPECWDGLPELFEGMVQPLAPTIPRGCWLQVLPEEPQEAPKRCWRAAGCYEVNLRQGEATLCTPPDPTIQNQQWENCHRLQSIPAIGREAALQSQCSERMYAGAAAGLLRNEAMLIWESCRSAGQKELSCKSFLASLKGIRFLAIV